MTDSEEWRAVVGYEGLYEVSSLGRVRSVKDPSYSGNGRDGRVLSPGGRAGYLEVSLFFRGLGNRGKKTVKVHRLVLSAFHRPPNYGEVANHKDCNRFNNRADNLEWTSHFGNMMHAKEAGRMRVRPTPQTKKEILACWLGGEAGASIAARFDVSDATIRAVTRGHRRARMRHREGKGATPCR